MASQIPCVKNGAAGFTFYVSLVSQADGKIFKANPTLAAGDVKIAIDDGAPANLNTLPAVDADFTKRVKVVLNQAETNGDNLTIIFSDAAGDEWCDLTVNIQTATQTFDTTDTAVDGVKTKTDGLNFTGNYVQAQVKGQDNIDFGATQKASISTAVFDYVVENLKTFEEVIRLILAPASGEATGGGTDEVVYYDDAGTKPRITMTVDSDGNRSAVVKDGS
jgi:hypothetical protein